MPAEDKVGTLPWAVGPPGNGPQLNIEVGGGGSNVEGGGSRGSPEWPQHVSSDCSGFAVCLALVPGYGPSIRCVAYFVGCRLTVA